MSFIGLLLITLVLLVNLKAYPNVFASKKRVAEAEKKFNEAWQKIDETPIGKGMTHGIIGISSVISLFLSFLLYLITSIVVNNPIMYVLGVIIFLLDILLNRKGMQSIRERKFKLSRVNKLALPLKTLYIIGFFILFFL